MPAKTFIVQKPQNKKYWDQNYVVFIKKIMRVFSD